MWRKNIICLFARWKIMEQALLSEQKFPIIHQRNLSTELFEEQLFKKRFTVMERTVFVGDDTHVHGRARSTQVCFEEELQKSSEDEQRLSQSSVQQHKSSPHFHLFLGGFLFCRGKKKTESIHTPWCTAAVWISRKGQLWTRRPEAKQNKHGVKYSGGRKAGERKEPRACRRYNRRVILQQEKQLPVWVFTAAAGFHPP